MFIVIYLMQKLIRRIFLNDIITLGNDKKLCENIWKLKIKKISQLWKRVSGKAVVMQTLSMSTIWYLLNVQPLID